MNYFLQFLWLLAWPILVLISYWVIKWILANYEHQLEEEENGNVN